MRGILLFAILIVLSGKVSGQQDYFYAENLIDHGQHAEAIRVLDNLIESKVYADRPRFEMMTLNLAGTTKLTLKDTVGGINCFKSAMLCYDTLTAPRKSDDWNRREYYIAGEKLARIEFANGKYENANDYLVQIQSPGVYYSASGHDVLAASDNYYALRARIFQKLNKPDSAFSCLRNMRSVEYCKAQREFDSIFTTETNFIQRIQCVQYTKRENEIRPGYFYFVTWRDKDHTLYSIWFINPENGPVEIIGRTIYSSGTENPFPANCDDMSLSPDEMYLAVNFYERENSYVEIYSFSDILGSKRMAPKHSIHVAGYSASIHDWQNTFLEIESDTDLTRLNKKQMFGIDTKAAEEKRAIYLFDPESGKYSRK